MRERDEVVRVSCYCAICGEALESDIEEVCADGKSLHVAIEPCRACLEDAVREQAEYDYLED